MVLFTASKFMFTGYINNRTLTEDTAENKRVPILVHQRSRQHYSQQGHHAGKNKQPKARLQRISRKVPEEVEKFLDKEVSKR